MLDKEEDSTIEASGAVRKAKSLLANAISHESHSKHRSEHADLGYLLHNDGYISTFKIFISKDRLDCLSVDIDVNEALTENTGAEDSRESDDDLINNLIKNY